MTGPSFDLTYDEKSNVLRFDSGPFIAVKRVTSHDGTLQLLGVSDDYYLRLDFDEPASVTFGETSSVPQMALCQSGADQHGY